ncbi:hypothetical protein BE21_43845 [Sorangium cellulosum]|uniref:Uncharacterized protein n=1 Tax=Sorangium cellulosum TaxID=56 RepID=A0A150TJU3_SORCE|nr:hypothetical protein BE21_43845 [Sorangium cellulosum]
MKPALQHRRQRRPHLRPRQARRRPSVLEEPELLPLHLLQRIGPVHLRMKVSPRPEIRLLARLERRHHEPRPRQRARIVVQIDPHHPPEHVLHDLPHRPPREFRLFVGTRAE